MRLRLCNKMQMGPTDPTSLLAGIISGPCLKICLMVFLLMSVPLYGQTVAGTVSGTVTDPSGAIVPGAAVKLTNSENGDVRLGQSNSSGLFSIPALPPGSYMLDAVVKGFKEETSSLTVAPGQILNINLKLVVGTSSEKVEVFSADSLGLQTESHELSSVMSAETLENTPQFGGYRGDTFYAQTTEVGIQPGSALGANNINSNVSQYNAQSNTLLIGGAGFWTASYLEDGVVDMSYFDQQATVQPPSEAVESTEVIRNAANARYDGANVVNVVTKSGTNQFHGRAYDYVENNVFNARGENNSNANAAGPNVVRYNKFGANAGWVVPFTRHKLFFFVDYQGYRQLSISTLSEFLPTPAEKSGDFSADLVPNTYGGQQGTTIYDPTTFNAAVTPNGGVNALQAFPGNKIPAGRISPLALAYLKLVYPDPNYVPGTNSSNNYNSTHARTKFVHDDYLYRVDYNISEKDHLYTAYNSNDPDIIRPEFVDDCVCKEDNQLFGKDFYIEESHVFNPNLVNTGRVGFSRSLTGQQFGQIGGGINYFSQLGLTGLSPNPAIWGWPGLNVGGYSGPSGSPLSAKQNMFEYSDEINWNRGKHQIFFGGEFDVVDYNAFWYTGSPNGGISANGQYTYNGLNGAIQPKQGTPAWQRPGSWVPTGTIPAANQLADYLLGYYSGTSASAGSQVGYFHQNNIMPYIQDDWRVLRNLTLNLGMRYDRFTVPLEKYGHAGYLDPNSGKYTEAGYLPNRYNFSPRVGAAYAVNDRTTIHGGGGIYFFQYSYYDLVNYTADPLYNTALNAVQTQATPVIWPSTSAGPNPNTGAGPGQQEYLTLNNIETIWSNMPPATGVFAPGGSTFTKTMPTSYSEQWNLAIQRTFGKNWIAQVDYIGSHTLHIFNYANINLASLPTAADVNPTSTADINSRRPFQAIQGNIEQYSKRGASKYDGLEVQLKKRFANSFEFNTNYVWQKSMDYQDSDHKATGQAGLNQHVDYGESDFLNPYVFKVSGIYELPIGPGKRWLNGKNWFEQQLGGWRFSGFLSVNAGPPINTAANDNSFTGGGIQMRGNRTCDPNKGAPHTLGQWFKTSCFSQPANYTFGTEHRNDIFGPRNTNLDLSGFKELALYERLKLQFRVDAFSALNHPLPQEPNNTISSAQFGQITGWGGTRNLQLSLKVLW